MGAVICVDDFILDAILGKTPGHRTLARIARAQIVVANRHGHVLHLNTEGLRKDILDWARVGRVAPLVVGCARCHCPAFLLDWVSLSVMQPGRAARVRELLLQSDDPFKSDFLARCPGDITTSGILTIVDSVLKGRW
jgi:hypothetical protein